MTDKLTPQQIHKITTKRRRTLVYLNREKQRCTYGALGGSLGVPPRSVARRHLGKRRPYVSWVVNKKTRMPTGYEACDRHDDLEHIDHVICDSKELEKEVKDYWNGVR
ncbi:MAG: hypothetical protein OXC53_06465 [Rhodobacteraceae bacterium]|nr:hypothetical protein [Paracoccaceae bacterium]